MRKIRTIAAVAMLSAALFGASGGIASAAPGANYKDVVPITGTADEPLVEGQTYTLSYNSSGTGRKVSGGFTLYNDNGFFLSGKTENICHDGGSTRIINLVNPPKKNGVPVAEYLVITIDSNGKETVEVFSFTEAEPARC